MKDVCVRAIWRPAVPRGPAWRRRVSGSLAGNDTVRPLRPVWLSTKTASRPRRLPRAHPDHRGSQETPGAREFLPWLPALSSVPESCDSGSICRRGSAVAFVCASERLHERRRHPVGAGEATARWRAVGPGRKCCPGCPRGRFPARTAPWAQIPAGWDHSFTP